MNSIFVLESTNKNSIKKRLVINPTLPFTVDTILNNIVHLSETQFPHLLNGENTTYLQQKVLVGTQ